MQKFKAVLFDMDGTILETEDLNFKIYRKMFLELYGMKMNLAEWRTCFAGVKPEESVRKFLEFKSGKIAAGYSWKQVSGVLETEKDKAMGKWRIKTVKGFRTFYKYLLKEGIATGLVTSTRSKYVERLLKKMGFTRFEVVITGEMMSMSKPNPEGYNMAIDKLGIKAEETCIFEDSINGLISAKRAGAYVIQVGDEFNKSGAADVVICNFSNLLDNKNLVNKFGK